jgi:hypothetical protein
LRNYHFYTADYFFINLWAAYMNSHGSAGSIEKRVARVISKIPSVSSVGKKTYGRLRKKLVAQLGDHRTNFNLFKCNFFMEESLPGTANRFGVTYEKVLARLAAM